MAPGRQEDWKWLLENVVIPLSGLAGIIYAVLGGIVPSWLFPVLPGMLAFPWVRQLDRRRRENGYDE